MLTVISRSPVRMGTGAARASDSIGEGGGLGREGASSALGDGDEVTEFYAG